MNKNSFFKGLIFLTMGLMILSSAQADVVVDSHYADDSYIEAGDEVNLHMKYHRAPLGSLVGAQGQIQDQNGNVVEQGSPDDFYMTRLVADSELSKENIIFKESKKQVGHISVGESWSSKFSIKMKEDAAAGEYELKAYVYKTNPDYEIEKTAFQQPITIEVRGNPYFNIEAENTFSVGSTDNVEVTLENNGGGVAKNVHVALELKEPFTPVDSSRKYVGDIPAGQKKKISYKASLATQAAVKTYKVPVKVGFRDNNGTPGQVSTTIGVTVDSKPSLTTGLDESDELAPGVSGEAVVLIANRGFVNAKFLEIELLESENYEIQSIKQMYIGNLDSDDIETQDFEIKVDENFDKEKLPLKIKLTYKGEGSDEIYTKESSIEVPVITKQEYQAKNQETSQQDMINQALIIVPAAFVGLLLIWFLYKLFGAITGFVNRKLFSR